MFETLLKAIYKENALKDTSAILSAPLHISWEEKFAKQPLNLMLELKEHWCVFSV